MLTFSNVTTAREIQRNYRKLFNRVKRTKEPLIVMRNNKPDVAIVDFKRLEELEAINVVLESYKEAQEGKVKVLKSLRDLWYEAKGN